MSLTDEELKGLLAENPSFQQVWDGLHPGLRRDYQRDYKNISGLRTYLERMAEALPAQAARSEETKKTLAALSRKATPPGQENPASDLLSAVFAGIGITGAAATAIMYHPNPHVYYCSMRTLTDALLTLDDNDTDLTYVPNGQGMTVSILELVQGDWVDAIEIRLTYTNDDGIKVEMGPLAIQAGVGKATDLVTTVLHTAEKLNNARRRGILGNLQGLAETIGDVSQEIRQKVVNQAQGLGLKFTIWNLLDKAARPEETAFFDARDAKVREAYEAQWELDRKEALKKCIACDTMLSQESLETRQCVHCGANVTSEAFEALTVKQ